MILIFMVVISDFLNELEFELSWLRINEVIQCPLFDGILPIQLCVE